MHNTQQDAHTQRFAMQSWKLARYSQPGSWRRSSRPTCASRGLNVAACTGFVKRSQQRLLQRADARLVCGKTSRPWPTHRGKKGCTLLARSIAAWSKKNKKVWLPLPSDFSMVTHSSLWTWSTLRASHRNRNVTRRGVAPPSPMVCQAMSQCHLLLCQALSQESFYTSREQET